MAHFDPTRLNVDMTRAVPSLPDMKILGEVFKENIRDATNRGDSELLKSMCDGLGQIRLRGICRRLSNSERAEMVGLLLPGVSHHSSPSQELVQRLLDSAPNLAALQDTFERVGFERFAEGPALRWFGECVALAQAMDRLQGSEYLTEVDDELENPDLAIEQIEQVLRHNADVFEGDDRTSCLPAALNARRLLDAFNEERWGIEDPIEFAKSWNERIKIHTTTGLGVYDSPDLRLLSDQLRDIRLGLERFPAYVLTLENVLLSMDFCCPPEGRDGALGAYNLGRIYLFDALKDARRGVDFPESAESAFTYTTVQETAHAAQTVGMMDFQKISGWIRVNNLTFRDPVTNQPHWIQGGAFRPGDVVEVESGRYQVSLYTEPETFDFPLEITIENCYNAAECGFLHREDAKFVNFYAATSPQEDYAETLTAFLLTPEKLKALAPEKFEFMNFLYGKISPS